MFNIYKLRLIILGAICLVGQICGTAPASNSYWVKLFTDIHLRKRLASEGAYFIRSFQDHQPEVNTETPDKGQKAIMLYPYEQYMASESKEWVTARTTGGGIEFIKTSNYKDTEGEIWVQFTSDNYVPPEVPSTGDLHRRSVGYILTYLTLEELKSPKADSKFKGVLEGVLEKMPEGNKTDIFALKVPLDPALYYAYNSFKMARWTAAQISPHGMSSEEIAKQNRIDEAKKTLPALTNALAEKFGQAQKSGTVPVLLIYVNKKYYDLGVLPQNRMANQLECKAESEFEVKGSSS